MTAMDNHLKSYAYVILSLLLTSMAFILNTIAVKSAGITSVAFFMFATASIVSGLLLVVSKKITLTKSLVRKYWKPIIAICVLNAVSAFLWLSSLKTIGPSLTSFLFRFGTIFTIIMSVVFLKERFSKLEILGAVIMIAGAFILSYNGGNFIITGIALVLLLSLLVSGWQLLTKIYIKHITPLVMNCVRLLFTFAIVGVYILSTQNLEVPSLNILVVIALGAVSGGVVGLLLFYKAMELADLSKVSTIQSLEPFVVVLYSFLILGSIPTAYQLFAGTIIIAGALLLVVARRRPKLVEKFSE